jgi:uncharacterized protein YfeS
MKVFISYTLKDKEINDEYLEKVNELQSLDRVSLFIDKLHNFDFYPQNRIEEEIENCDILLVVGTKNIFKSDWVKKEIEIARLKNRPIYFTSPEKINKTIKSVYNILYK